MKIFMKTFVGLVFVVLLSGCSVYQHVNLASNLPQNDKFEFLIENDSVNISYSFYGQNGPIHIELFNKLDKPLYIDWRKSALIANGQSNSFWKDEARISGSTTEYKIIPENPIVSSISNTEGTIVKQDKVTFIPPRSNISFDSYVLYSTFFKTPVESSERVNVYTTEGRVNVKKFSFSEDDSPLNFRIFLSISENDSFKNPVQFDNTFWVSSYFSTSSSPKSWGIVSGNQFYIRETTGFGTTVGIVALVGLISLGAIAGDGSGN